MNKHNRRIELFVIIVAVILTHIITAQNVFSAAEGDFTLLPIANVKYGYPQKYSGEIGVIIGKQHLFGVGGDVKGLVLTVEPGTEALKLHAGYGKSIWVLLAPSSYRVSVSYMRYSEDINGMHDGDSAYGIELSGSYMYLIGSMGGFYSLDNGKVIGSISVGVGF